MRSTRMLFGSTGAFLISASAFAAASPFTYNLVLNEQTDLGGASYEGSLQVVMGNNGLIITNSFVSGTPVILAHQGGDTTFLVTAGDDYSEFSELALSQATNTVTFKGDNAGTLSLYQIDAGGGTRQTVREGVNFLNSHASSDSHYQVNDSGVAVVKYRTGGSPGTQHFDVVSQGSPLATVTDMATQGLTDFNLPVSRRHAITSLGNVVFSATQAGANGIFRLDGNDITELDLPGVVSGGQSRVMGASDNAVLYTAADDPLPDSITTLNLQIDAEAVVPLVSYQQDTGLPRALNAVMTSNNHVAYFANTFVGYYDSANGQHTVAAVGQDVGNGLEIAQISAHALRNSNPMVNDAGVVVFDAILTDTASHSAEVIALLAWDVNSQQLSVVVTAHINDPSLQYSSTFGEDKVTNFILDETGFGSDVLKDALSDDSVLGFFMYYGDGHGGLVTVAVPEPATAGLVLAGGLMLRRRRRA